MDHVPLPAHLFGENQLGNPWDVVEIRADVVLEQARNARKDVILDADIHERIDWWLEEGGDEYACILLSGQATNCIVG